jgi:hypothetical protein
VSSDLHFDIRNNNVIFYQNEKSVEQIATALIAAANAFEVDAERFIRTITHSLSPLAILCLKWYANANNRGKPFQSLHDGHAKEIFAKKAPGDELMMFQLATTELIQKRLMFTSYTTYPEKNRDEYGMVATNLGAVVINHLWPVQQPTQHQTVLEVLNA